MHTPEFPTSHKKAGDHGKPKRHPAEEYGRGKLRFKRNLEQMARQSTHKKHFTAAIF